MLTIEQTSPDACLIKRNENIVAGSIVRVDYDWRVEIMWTGPGGDIVYQAGSLQIAAGFVVGVGAMMERLAALAPPQPASPAA